MGRSFGTFKLANFRHSILKTFVEDHKSIIFFCRKMVPIRDTTTTKDVAKIVASKVGIANPGDYVLVRIKDGEGKPNHWKKDSQGHPTLTLTLLRPITLISSIFPEKLCPDGELVSRFLEDNMTALAYKRMDAKIGWPLKIA